MLVVSKGEEKEDREMRTKGERKEERKCRSERDYLNKLSPDHWPVQ